MPREIGEVVVSVLVADLVMPSGDWRASGIVLHAGAEAKDNVVLKYGDFLGAVVDFFIVAGVLFVLVSKIVKEAESRLAPPKPVGAPATKECPFCIETIPAKATRCRACVRARFSPTRG